MNSKKNKYAGRFFKTLLPSTFLFYSLEGKTFHTEKDTTILILSDELFRVARNPKQPCFKILVLSGIHRGKVCYEYVTDIQNKFSYNYEEL